MDRRVRDALRARDGRAGQRRRPRGHLRRRAAACATRAVGGVPCPLHHLRRALRRRRALDSTPPPAVGQGVLLAGCCPPAIACPGAALAALPLVRFLRRSQRVVADRQRLQLGARRRRRRADAGARGRRGVQHHQHARLRHVVDRRGDPRGRRHRALHAGRRHPRRQGGAHAQGAPRRGAMARAGRRRCDERRRDGERGHRRGGECAHRCSVLHSRSERRNRLCHGDGAARALAHRRGVARTVGGGGEDD
mmetsp:Transcript_53792/g.165500  ORF Transcript_53792/g.165500 Transcript_53792/m.165500 type:complete len:250 (+) Transcript_53792:747-1496(+)